MGAPSTPGIALVLRRELPDIVTADEVLALARSSGIERATLQPKCVGYRRVSATGVTRQMYFLAFEVSGFAAFRQALAPRAAAGYDAAALSPVMMMAAQPNFAGWQPIANAERDCIAPVVIS